MNETIKEGNSAYAHDITKPRKAMKLVMDRMAQLRPRREVQLKPYWRQPMYSQQGLFGAVKLDMNAGYPQAELGDVAPGCGQNRRRRPSSICGEGAASGLERNAFMTERNREAGLLYR